MKLSTFLRCGLATVLLSSVLWVCVTPGQADEKSVKTSQIPPPTAQPLFTDWRLVAQSTFILDGQLEVPVQAIKKAIASGKNGYLTLNVRILTALKGQPNKPLVPVSFDSESVDYAPSMATLLKLNHKEVLVFLVQSDDSGPTLYFAGYTPKALQPFDKAKTLQVQKEVENQKSILAHFAKSPEAQPDAYDSQVKILIAGMLFPLTEQTAFDALVALGPAAAPATIRLMDDRRRLPIQHLTIRNTSPNRFEEFAQYGPRVLVDALSTLVRAPEEFGTLENGGSERERQSAVNGWRVYLHYRFAQNAAGKAKKLPAGSN